VLRFSEHLSADQGEAMFRHACAMGAGGIARRREFKLTELASVGGLVTRRIEHLEMLAAVSSQSLRLASGQS
jgi:hypothetical protein